LEIGGASVTAAMLLAAAVLLYYLVLDLLLGIGMVLVTVALVWLGALLAAQGTAAGWIWFAALFIGGWILQLVGHAFEGRRPALADNLFQIFVAPIFLCAEVVFALGYRPQLHAAVQERALRMRAKS
jgi:uncharacterized membrane protein YGL010W